MTKRGVNSPHLYLHAKYLFDEVYDANGISGGYAVYSKPRKIGVHLSYRFQPVPYTTGPLGQARLQRHRLCPADGLKPFVEYPFRAEVSADHPLVSTGIDTDSFVSYICSKQNIHRK